MRTIWFGVFICLAVVEVGIAAPVTIDEAVREALANSPLIHEQEAYHQAAAFGEHRVIEMKGVRPYNRVNTACVLPGDRPRMADLIKQRD